MVLPDDFFWGGGAASVAIDGAGRRSDWFRWEQSGAVDPSLTGNDSWDRHEEDFALFRAHGLSQIRLTVEWARIEPFPGRLDVEAIEQMQQRLHGAREAGLSPWLTLHHGSLPGWFSEDTDGFATTIGPSIHWSRHVDRMAELFDEHTAFWVPIEDPLGWAIRGHHLGSRPPGRSSEQRTRDALEGVLDATFEAHRLLSSGSTPIVGSFALPALHSIDPEAGNERRHWERIIWDSWIGAISEGVLEWPWRAPVERPEMAEAFDLIAIGLASPINVLPDGGFGPWPIDARIDASGLAPNPEQFGEVLHKVIETLGDRELVIAGLGASTADDNWRMDLLAGWLEQISLAAADGARIRGAFFDPLIDGYDLAASAHLESGLFSRSREPKPSLGWVAAQQ